jgi:hypothetical protein
MIETILKDRTKIISTFEQNGLWIQRLQKPEGSNVDEALLKWFKQKISDNAPASGHLLKTEAEEFAKKLSAVVAGLAGSSCVTFPSVKWAAKPRV